MHPKLKSLETTVSKKKKKNKFKVQNTTMGTAQGLTLLTSMYITRSYLVIMHKSCLIILRYPLYY